MSNGAAAGGAAGGAAAAAAAAVAKAVKASGTLVKVEPEEFRKVLERNPEGLVVTAEAGVFGTKYQYLTSYKGLAFFTSTKRALQLPGTAEVVQAEKIWMPS